MFTSNHNRQSIALALMTVLFTAAGCNQKINIERVIITPSTPSGAGTSSISITPATPPIKLLSGQEADLTIDVRGISVRDVVLWSVETGAGKFKRDADRTATTYVAPDQPGYYRINCAVSSNGQTTAIQVPIEVVAQVPAQDTHLKTPAAPILPSKEEVKPQPTPSEAEELAANPQEAVTGTGPFRIEDGGFVPCGWMGDGEFAKTITVDERDRDHPPQAGPTSQRWTYTPGAVGWAAVGWQFPGKPCNWGGRKGKDLSRRPFTQVTFWAKGVPDSEGRLPKLQFKAGGNTDPTKRYKASFAVEGDFVTLTPDWARYTLDLRGQNLAMVVGAFTWVIRAKDNPNGAKFYLAEIMYG